MKLTETENKNVTDSIALKAIKIFAIFAIFVIFSLIDVFSARMRNPTKKER